MHWDDIAGQDVSILFLQVPEDSRVYQVQPSKSMTAADVLYSFFDPKLVQLKLVEIVEGEPKVHWDEKHHNFVPLDSRSQ